MMSVLLLALSIGGWQPTVDLMSDPRWAPSASMLPGGGQALVAGGYSYATRRCVATADLFDEKTRRFIPCRGRLTYPRDFATAAPLPDGHVLIAGGYNTRLGTLDTAEIYDPASQSFRVLGSHLGAGRELFQATSLADGRVLLTGGFNTHSGRTQASADIFDPRTLSFTPTAGSMQQDRFGHAAARLADGRVLIVGGKSWAIGRPDKPLASAEIFDPVTGRFHFTKAPMAVPRDRPTATLLADGMVLIAGGQNGPDGPRIAELFDPKTDTFLPLTHPLNTSRMAHADALLPDGRVLLAGGWSPTLGATTATTELYDPATQVFSAGPSLPESTHDLALIAFPDGIVLAAGGKQVENSQERSLASGSCWQANLP